MRSIQQDSAQGTTWAGRLCPECGLCCNGVLFADVRLQKGDDPLALGAAGLALDRVRGRSVLLQPCPCFDGRLCCIYRDRPGRCRDFECYTLKRLQRGDLDFAQALRPIRDAVRRADRVRHLLHELGQTDESRPLTHRYRAVMQQPVDLSDGGRVADLRGELMLAVGELMDLVHREFLNPEPPAHEFPAGRSTKRPTKPRRS